MLKDKLKELREKQKFTKKQVALGVGITERAYIAYEYGERDVSTETLSKLADFYGVTTDYLLAREPPDKHPEPLELLSKQNYMDNAEEILFEKYLELPEATRKELIKMMYSFADALRRNAENKPDYK